MSFPQNRLRRLRKSPTLRSMIQETTVLPKDLVYPMFVGEGHGFRKEVSSMPGVWQMSIDQLLPVLTTVQALQIPGIMLFGIPDHKDSKGSGAYARDGIIQRAAREIKSRFPDLTLITDVCLCEYTDHGHCGVLENGEVHNDQTLELIARTAISHAQSGVDMLAPSGMMDGQVRAIRTALDSEGFSSLPVMAYSAKYASAFYGPFREAACSAPQQGDRCGCQMDPSNKLEAMREVALDIEEGADIVMIKPAMSYLDVIYMVSQQFHWPLAAYNVSGEYAMVKAAAQRGWIDEKKVTMELLYSIKRAGADIIISYFALDAARWIQEACGKEKV
jgi:porphobilinogen synthase